MLFKVTKKLHNFITNIGLAFSLFCLKLLKLSLTYGSYISFFSLGSALSPLLGKFKHKKNIGIILALRLLCLKLTTKVTLIACSLYHIPTFFAAWYINTSSKYMQICIPIACTMLFIAHPTGAQAWMYSLYWLIPTLIPVIQLYKRSNSVVTMFMTCLGATFTQHAVGSVIWLYTRTIPVSVWHGLIGIVWAERLLFAALMTCAYYIYQAIYTTVDITKKQRALQTML